MLLLGFLRFMKLHPWLPKSDIQDIDGSYDDKLMKSTNRFVQITSFNVRDHAIRAHDGGGIHVFANALFAPAPVPYLYSNEETMVLATSAAMGWWGDQYWRKDTYLVALDIRNGPHPKFQSVGTLDGY